MKVLNQIPSASDWSIYFPSFAFKSTFTGAQQNAPMLGAHWKVSLQFPLKKGDEKAKLRALVNSLQGRVGLIKIYDDTRPGFQAKGFPVVSGDNLKGAHLPTVGWSPNELVMQVGDLFTVNDELKEITEDIYSGDSGFAVLKFQPPIRKSPANSDRVITYKPYGVFRLDSNSVDISNQLGGFADFGTLKFVEAIY